MARGPSLRAGEGPGLLGRAKRAVRGGLRPPRLNGSDEGGAGTTSYRARGGRFWSSCDQNRPRIAMTAAFWSSCDTNAAPVADLSWVVVAGRPKGGTNPKPAPDPLPNRAVPAAPTADRREPRASHARRGRARPPPGRPPAPRVCRLPGPYAASAMPANERPLKRWDTGRVEAFSDGVFAIAI